MQMKMLVVDYLTIFNVNHSSTAPYPKLLKVADNNPSNKQINVVFHRMTKKSDGGKFMNVGEYALLNCCFTK